MVIRFDIFSVNTHTHEHKQLSTHIPGKHTENVGLIIILFQNCTKRLSNENFVAFENNNDVIVIIKLKCLWMHSGTFTRFCSHVFVFVSVSMWTSNNKMTTTTTASVELYVCESCPHPLACRTESCCDFDIIWASICWWIWHGWQIWQDLWGHSVLLNPSGPENQSRSLFWMCSTGLL